MGMIVIVVVANLLLSLRGARRLVAQDLALRWVWTGVVFYLLVSLQGSFQAAMAVQEQLHFSDWVIGHAHLALAGFATFTVIGGIAHVWRRVAGRLPHGPSLEWAYWVSLAALLIMVVDLTAVGLVQAGMWMRGESWIATVTASRAGWWIRTWSGVLLAGGFAMVLLSLFPLTAPAHQGPLARAREAAVGGSRG